MLRSFLKSAFVCALASCAVYGAHAEDLLISDVAYDVAQREHSADEWKRLTDETRKKFASWQETHSDIADDSRYLNDQLVTYAMSVMGGDVAKLHKACDFLAQYRILQLSPSPRLVALSHQYQDDVVEFSRDFNWERLSARILERLSQHSNLRKELGKK